MKMMQRYSICKESLNNWADFAMLICDESSIQAQPKPLANKKRKFLK